LRTRGGRVSRYRVSRHRDSLSAFPCDHSRGCGSLSGVSVLPSGHAWAVGSQILHWNGTAWKTVPLT